MQDQNSLKESDPAEEQQTSENERVEVAEEEETKDSEVVDEEVRRNSLIKVVKMKKNAGALTKKTKEKAPKQTLFWDRFSRTSSKVPLFFKQGCLGTCVRSVIYCNYCAFCLSIVVLDHT